ncbi:hypothetical protein BC629DRAFT_41264 [Irpex lacteus]|nr:hypothetical protein BC629DRAFT_41264 [Irpex lacteus]
MASESGAASFDADHTIKVKTITGKELTFPYHLTDTVADLKHRIQNVEDVQPCSQVLTFNSRQLEDHRLLRDYGIPSGTSIDLTLKLKGGKPVIYVFAPRPLENVSVTLGLTLGWSFSAVYPPTSVTHHGSEEKVQWNVDVAKDGTLLDKATSLEVSYLFWEAETHPALPLTPASSRPSSPTPIEQPRAFDPSCPSITPDTAVLLPIEKVPVYLDQALKALTLHTEARTSFITYWLPSLLKHKHVALQFLPQKSYEAAAPMTISPVPDVVTRVFMLFRGVEEKDLGAWEAGSSCAVCEPSFWQETVGVDIAKASDVNQYRVLEWGGMEVC